MRDGWSDRTPRFQEERKPLVERPPMNVGPEFCWCGEQHGGEGNYKHAGVHPWPKMEFLEDPE